VINSRRPRTGEPRKTNQPLKIDRLPPDVLDAILDLRNKAPFRTWEQIQNLSALPKEQGGFVDWDKLPLETLKLFPEMRLGHTTLHRWYDLRIAQARKDVLQESVLAQKFASAFSGLNLPNANEAVVNALQAQIFGLIRNARAGDEDAFQKGLKDLTLAMTRMQRVELQARRVAVDEKAVQIKLDLIKEKAGKLIGEMEGRDGKPAVALTREDLLEKVREIYGAV
jgi:hypothetical protein